MIRSRLKHDEMSEIELASVINILRFIEYRKTRILFNEDITKSCIILADQENGLSYLHQFILLINKMMLNYSNVNSRDKMKEKLVKVIQQILLVKKKDPQIGEFTLKLNLTYNYNTTKKITENEEMLQKLSYTKKKKLEQKKNSLENKKLLDFLVFWKKPVSQTDIRPKQDIKNDATVVLKAIIKGNMNTNEKNSLERLKQVIVDISSSFNLNIEKFMTEIALFNYMNGLLSIGQYSIILRAISIFHQRIKNLGNYTNKENTEIEPNYATETRSFGKNLYILLSVENKPVELNKIIQKLLKLINKSKTKVDIKESINQYINIKNDINENVFDMLFNQ